MKKIKPYFDVNFAYGFVTGIIVSVIIILCMWP
jgi:capsular polysaccharide biosynthesis protein